MLTFIFQVSFILKKNTKKLNKNIKGYIYKVAKYSEGKFLPYEKNIHYINIMVNLTFSMYLLGHKHFFLHSPNLYY